MTNRRRIRIDVDLPELSPAQARFLRNFLDDLGSDLWDAYERELLNIETQGPSSDWIVEHTDSYCSADDVPTPTDANFNACPFRSSHGHGMCPTCGYDPNPEF